MLTGKRKAAAVKETKDKDAKPTAQKPKKVQSERARSQPIAVVVVARHWLAVVCVCEQKYRSLTAGQAAVVATAVADCKEERPAAAFDLAAAAKRAHLTEAQLLRRMRRPSQGGRQADRRPGTGRPLHSAPAQ